MLVRSDSPTIHCDFQEQARFPRTSLSPGRLIVNMSTEVHEITRDPVSNLQHTSFKLNMCTFCFMHVVKMCILQVVKIMGKFYLTQKTNVPMLYAAMQQLTMVDMATQLFL